MVFCLLCFSKTSLVPKSFHIKLYRVRTRTFMAQFCKKNGLFNILLFPLHALLWLCHRLPVTTHLLDPMGSSHFNIFGVRGWWWCWTFIIEPLVPPGTQDLILCQMLCISPTASAPGLFFSPPFSLLPPAVAISWISRFYSSALLLSMPPHLSPNFLSSATDFWTCAWIQPHLTPKPPFSCLLVTEHNLNCTHPKHNLILSSHAPSGVNCIPLHQASRAETQEIFPEAPSPWALTPIRYWVLRQSISLISLLSTGEDQPKSLTISHPYYTARLQLLAFSIIPPPHSLCIMLVWLST